MSVEKIGMYTLTVILASLMGNEVINLVAFPNNFSPEVLIVSVALVMLSVGYEYAYLRQRK